MTLSSPGEVMGRLEEIEREMAERQNPYENAAGAWVQKQRDIKKAHADAYLRAAGTAGERKAKADLAVAEMGVTEEAWHAYHKSGVEVLKARASVLQSILNGQTRGGGA